MDVHGARAAREGDAPNAVEQLRPGHDDPGPQREMPQQVELSARELDLSARDGDRAGLAIELDVPREQPIVGLVGLHPPEHGAHARGELTGRERLGDVVVCTELEPGHPIDLLVRAYLERDGFRVVWATRGTEGLAELERNDIRLAILDLQLPDADGFDVCRAIRSTSSLPVVMLTARDEEVDRVTGLELGADDFVTKPFSPRELAARILRVGMQVEVKRADDGSAGVVRVLRAGT